MLQITREDVESFLADFNAKLSVFDIIFLKRKKNEETLRQLEINAFDEIEYIKSLSPENYFKGPTKDAFDPESPPNWEFGKVIKGREIYIKINLGKSNKRVMCISFHIAENEMNYPLKKNKV
jgi:hypothetical protein